MLPRQTPARVLGLVASLALAASALAQEFDAKIKREVLDEVQSTLTTRAYVGGVRFSQWKDHEAKYFDRLDAAGSPEAFAAVVNGALAEFGVSHAALIPPSMAGEGRASVVGIGVSVRFTNDGGLRVLRVLDDSPAAGAGLSPGDVIIQIDGAAPKDPAQLEGEPDSKVEVRVRKLSGQRLDLSLTRRLIITRTPATLTVFDESGSKVDLPPGARISDDRRLFGLIRLPTFANEYSQPEIKAIFRRCMGLSGLIIDLRDNGGGAVVYMQHFLSFLLIADQPIGVAVSSEMAAQYVEATGGDPSDVVKVAAWSDDPITVPANPIRPFPGPIVVLLNRGSASASELSAQALRELHDAKICGHTSAGALLVSITLPMPGNFVLQVPISDYVSAQGVRPEGVGISPDIQPSRTPTHPGLDPDVDAALNALLAETDPTRQNP